MGVTFVFLWIRQNVCSTFYFKNVDKFINKTPQVTYNKENR